MATIIGAGLPGREGVEHRKEFGEAYRDALGALDLDSLAGDEAGDARRASRCGGRRRRRPYPHPEGGWGPHAPGSHRASSRCGRQWPRSAFVTVSMRSDSFTRSSCAPAHDALAARHRGARARTAAARRSSAAPRPARSSVATSSARSHLEVGDRLAAVRAPVVDGDPRAHPLEHVEQADARRVDADAVQPQLASPAAASPRRGTAPPTRSRPARRATAAGAARPARRPARRGFRCDPRPGRREHALGVVAARAGSDHRRRPPSAYSPASSTHDFTCALATGSS